MNRNLEHYARKYKFLDKDTCETTMKELNVLATGQNVEEEFVQHTFYNARKNEYKPISGSQELDITYADTSTTKLVMDKLWHQLNIYMKDLNFNWFNSWDGYSKVRWNRYSENKKMALHIDHIKSLFDGDRKGIPTLSCLGVLNDDYEGGEFVMWDNKVIPLEQGDLLIFPSNFLYPHKVQPVKKGIRYSYISFVW
jgi:hypothetical protein